MSIRISPIVALALASVLPACETIFFQKKMSCNPLQANASYSKTQRNACLKSLKREIKSCLNQTHCAETKYKIAIIYLNGASPSGRDLDNAAHHLTKAVQVGKYRQHARALNKVLLGWINESAESNKLRIANQKLHDKNLELLINMERSKAVDLE